MNELQQRSIKIMPHIVGERFFTVPTFKTPIDTPSLTGRLFQPENVQIERKEQTIMRYAAYMRISSEEQIGNFSIDAQRRAIESWVVA